MFQNALPWDNY